MTYKELSERLTKTLREKVTKDIEAVVWLDKQVGIKFEVIFTGFDPETEICSGVVTNRGEVNFYRKSSMLPLSETTTLAPYQITKLKKLVKKFLEGAITP